MEILILENQILIMEVLKELETTSWEKYKELEDRILFIKARINESR